MSKPTLQQLRDLLDSLGYTPRYAAQVLQQRGVSVTENAMRQFARGKTSCPPGIYRELLEVEKARNH